jgi:hypothetical protein
VQIQEYLTAAIQNLMTLLRNFKEPVYREALLIDKRPPRIFFALVLSIEILFAEIRKYIFPRRNSNQVSNCESIKNLLWATGR